MEIVFDTYAWIEYFNATKKGEIVKEYLENNKIITPAIVLLELSYKANKEGWNFKKFFNFINHHSKITGIDEEFIFSFGKTYNDVRKKVKKIGITDIIIFNTALLSNAKILTGDPHFSKLKNSIML